MSAAVPAPYQYQAQQNQFSPPHSLSQPPPPPQYLTSQSTHYSTTLQYIQSLGPPSQRPPQNGPPQFMYPPSQYLSPTVQCPCCSTRFTHFVIQYDSALTPWSFGAPSPAAPPMMPPAAMPPQYAPAPAQQRASMPTQNIDFDQYLNKVLSVYNKYSSSSSSKEYDNAFDARSEIEGIIQTIREQASKVSFAGKQDAICAIINIGLELLDEGGSTLDSEIRKGLDWSTVGGSIEGILELLSHDEIAILREDGDMAENLHRLKDDAEQYALDPSLDEPILMVTTIASEQEDEDDEGDDDGSEDEDHRGI